MFNNNLNSYLTMLNSYNNLKSQTQQESNLNINSYQNPYTFQSLLNYNNNNVAYQNQNVNSEMIIEMLNQKRLRTEQQIPDVTSQTYMNSLLNNNSLGNNNNINYENYYQLLNNLASGFVNNNNRENSNQGNTGN